MGAWCSSPRKEEPKEHTVVHVAKQPTSCSVSKTLPTPVNPYMPGALAPENGMINK